MEIEFYGIKKGFFSSNIHNFRQLWQLVSLICSFTNEQYERGRYNSNSEKFTEEEAIHISECLQSYLDDKGIYFDILLWF